MNNLWRYVFDKIVPHIVTGVVGIILYPVVLTACRYTTGVPNFNTGTQAIVFQLEQNSDIKKILPLRLRFQKVGVLVALEEGCLGTKINPILSTGTFVFAQVNSFHSLRLRGESFSQTEQMESTLDLSDLSESLDLSDFSDSEDSKDFSAIIQEPLDLVILRKKNLLTRCLEESKKLNSRIYGILALFSEIWVDVYKADVPEMPDFASYSNPSYEPTERDITSPVYFRIKSGTRHLFRKIGQFEGLRTRLEESSSQRERLQKDVETDIRIFCQLLSELREEYSYKYMNSEAQRTIETYFQDLSIEIERKRFDVALHESNERYLTSQSEQFQRDLRSIISTNHQLKREVIWEIEHYLLQNSQVTVERYQLEIDHLRKEIELMEELHQKNLNLQNNGLFILNQVTSDNWVQIHRTSIPDPDLSRFTRYENPYYQSDPGPDISSFARS